MSNGSSRKRKWDLDDSGQQVAPSAVKEEDKEKNLQKEQKEEKTNGIQAQEEEIDRRQEEKREKSTEEAVSSALEAASRINAMFAAKQRTERVEDINNAKATSTTTTTKPTMTGRPGERSLAAALGLLDEDEEGGAGATDKKPKIEANFRKTIDINDSRHRYYLIRPQTIEEIGRHSTVAITSKGKYYPDRAMATEKDPPLYLEIVGPTEEAIEKAITRINELKEHGPPTPIAPPSRANPIPEMVGKVFANIESDLVGFNVRGKILGPQGSFLKHIQSVTNTRVHLRGKGSGYVEIGQRVFRAHRQEDLDKAKQLGEDLLATVKGDLEAMRAQAVTVPALQQEPTSGMYPYGAYPPPYGGQLYGNPYGLPMGYPVAGYHPSYGMYGAMPPAATLPSPSSFPNLAPPPTQAFTDAAPRESDPKDEPQPPHLNHQ